MRARVAIAGLLGALALWPMSARASGDVSCEPTWTLAAAQVDCANRIVIGPGNDTRANLLLLLRDRAGLDGRGVEYPEPEWATGYGQVFFDWSQLSRAFYQKPEVEYDTLFGTRCQSLRAGSEQFLAAAARNRRISATDRQALAGGRETLQAVCEREEGTPETLADLGLPQRYAGTEAREFGTYLTGAAAFYLGDWRAARERFSVAANARDAWVREAARYMVARTELNAANDAAFDEWSYFDPAKVDMPAADRASSGFSAYLKDYPQGRYAASATGLQRRAWWLLGALKQQGEAYAALLDKIDPSAPTAVDLIEEIDNKFLLHEHAETGLDGPLLIAVHDLMRMRRDEPGGEEGDGYERHGQPLLSARDLAAHRAAFGGDDELYDFLHANQAFYVDRDYHRVLQLIPDDAKRGSYSPVQFSRQVLRGMALAELKDPNEAGFWLELSEGAEGLYQRPTIELGLALNWERIGQLARVFTASSPVQDGRIRSILLAYSAGPAVLRNAARDSARPPRERDLAALVLLYKQLTRGAYAAAGQDLALVRAGAPTDTGLWDVSAQEEVPAGLFVGGRTAEDYPCPALRQTVAQLAASPRAAKARLCLGDFFRLNGFDDLALDGVRQKGELGSFAAFPGAPMPRAQIYRDVLADAAAPREDKAYALYRSVYCYAPSGNNTCGGADVPEAQRQAWFQRLKREFADTRWAREIEYFW